MKIDAKLLGSLLINFLSQLPVSYLRFRVFHCKTLNLLVAEVCTMFAQSFILKEMCEAFVYIYKFIFL